MSEAQLRTQLGAVGLSHIVDRVIGVSQPAVYLGTTAQPQDHILTGVSKFGGSPDLPATLAWPAWQDKPQGFIAQINLADIAQYAPAGILPERGMLYFFYDLWEQPGGFDPKDRGAGRVIYFDGDLAQIHHRPAPPGTYDPIYPAPFTACAMTSFSELSFPSPSSSLLDSLSMSQEDVDCYCEWAYDFYRKAAPCHQLLGLPYLIQDDMEMECQLASNGVYVGDPTGWNDPRHNHLKASAPDWRLLLQVDSDETPGMMWGDGGIIYYWIRRQDLAVRNFDNTWLILQCT